MDKSSKNNLKNDNIQLKNNTERMGDNRLF